MMILLRSYVFIFILNALNFSISTTYVQIGHTRAPQDLHGSHSTFASKKIRKIDFRCSVYTQNCDAVSWLQTRQYDIFTDIHVPLPTRTYAENLSNRCWDSTWQCLIMVNITKTWNGRINFHEQWGFFGKSSNIRQAIRKLYFIILAYGNPPRSSYFFFLTPKMYDRDRK